MFKIPLRLLSLFSRRLFPTITMGSFLVGAFSLKKKSPTLTVSSLQFVHLSYLFIIDQAGERGFDSRTEP